MNKNVLKILITLFLFTQSICFAAEEMQIQMGNDYLITSSEKINTSFVSDTNVLTINPFFTIFNEKNVLLMHPQKTGKSNLAIFSDKGDYLYSVTVIPKKTKPDSRIIIKGPFEIMILDTPPETKKNNLDKLPADINGGA